ncbi:SUMO-activating enzyme subunit 2, partial [Operophtera brumata]
MVARVAGVFDEKLTEAIANSKILVVGAGGIGCEVLKNLVLTGFPTIEIIDLDTIDVSNLNRQFLFHKEHVGKSKAQVAKDSALSFNPNVEVIKKGLSQCYECQPKAPQKTFPGCTIRNTPSEPIHCIVWAKHLFNQLFGEEDPDQDVSPDTADPEAAGQAGAEALTTEGTTAVKLFSKLFGDDIRYLLSMENLWRVRRPPTPL